MRTRIKICGITCEQDALAAAEAGVDALGLVFYAPSPRNLGIEQATSICKALPVFVNSVALFMNADAALVAQVVEQVQPDYLQFHGGESAGFCRQFGQAYIKALPMADEDSQAALTRQADEYHDAAALLLDGHRSGQAGGQGQAFDWNLGLPALPQKMILAGGLSMNNVASAIRQLRPWAVDISSGVEASPGIKDKDKMKQFAKEVMHGDAS